MKEIKIGRSIPTFTLPDQNGNLFDISSVLGKKNLVIYFYPVLNSQMQAEKHVAKALRILKELK